MSNVTFSISVDSEMLDDNDPVPASLQSRIYYQKGGSDLDLSLCSIANVPLEAIRELFGEVTSLNLSYNRIRILPSNFVNEMRSSLRTLDLSRNQLKRLPDNFGELDQLVFLDIHQNKLKSLPLSMGKMTRLTYLNLSDNPFGPPLRDFLEFEKRESNGEKCVIGTAHSVINFLATVSHQSISTKDIYEDLPPTTSSVQRQRTVTFVQETSNREKSKSTLTQQQHTRSMEASITTTIIETEGNSEDDEIKEDEFIPKKYEVKYSESELGPYLTKKTDKNPSWGHGHPKVPCGLGQTLALPSPKGVVILPEDEGKSYKLYGFFMFVIWLLMFPVMMTMFYETTAVDHMVKGSESLETFWKEYRPYHEGIEIGMGFIRLNQGIVVRAPSPKKSKYYDVDPLTAMIYAFREALASFFQSMANFIQPASAGRLDINFKIYQSHRKFAHK